MRKTNLRPRRVAWEIALVLLLVALSALAAIAGQGIRMPGTRRPAAPTPPLPGPTVPALATPATGASVAAQPAPAAPAGQPKLPEVFQTAGGGIEVSMEIYNVDIDYLLRLLSEAAGVTIIKSEQVTGNVTIISPKRVPLDVAFQILNSVLEVRGFTMLRTATGIYKVIPISDAVQSGPPIGFGANPEDVPSTDSFITQVIPLANLDASDVAGQIQGLLSANANIVPTSTNSLIITDTASNIQRVLTIIADDESQLSGGFRAFPLRYYPAEDMCDLINSIVLGRGGAGMAGAPGAAAARRPFERRVATAARPGQPAGAARPGVAAGLTGVGPEFCYPDTRTNSVIALATPIHVQQIQSLVDQLDRPISLRDSYFVYPVQNLIASDLAQKIGPLLAAQVNVTPALGGGVLGAGAPGTTVGGRGVTGTSPYGGAAGTRLPSASQRLLGAASVPAESPDRAVRTATVELEPTAGASAHSAPDPITVAQIPQTPGPEFPIQPQPAVPPIEITGAAPEAVLSAGPAIRQPTITADDNTNTLLISASPEQLDLVRQLLEQLDIAPPQVHIRAIIAEVTLTRNNSLGFQFEQLGRVLGKFQGNTFTGDVGSNFGLISRDSKGNVIPPTGLFGTATSVFSELTGEQFNAALTALTTDTHARILSTPSIFTSNNQEAQIDVSSSRPFPSGSLTTSLGTGAAISTSVNYQSVGIVLTVLPRITQGNMVQMVVTVSADEPGANVNVGGQDFPSVNRRQARANISVKDGNTIIIGGLMRDTLTRTGSKVPILGDIPVLGSLFRSTSSAREKSELLVFLTPQVVRSPAQAAAITDSVKKHMLETPRSLQGPSAGPAAPDKK